MNTNNEKNSIRISVILILLAFMLIYKLFIDKNQQIISSIIYSPSSNLSSWQIVKSDNTANINNNNKGTQIDKKIPESQIVTEELQSLSILKLPYKYITKWPSSIYIVYLNNFDQSEKNRIMYENSGNYKIINTQKQKIIDQIEWDEIIYINNVNWKWKLVVFVVTKWSDTWLIQVNKDDYYKYKKYIYYNLTN